MTINKVATVLDIEKESVEDILSSIKDIVSSNSSIEELETLIDLFKDISNLATKYRTEMEVRKALKVIDVDTSHVSDLLEAELPSFNWYSSCGNNGISYVLKYEGICLNLSIELYFFIASRLWKAKVIFHLGNNRYELGQEISNTDINQVIKKIHEVLDALRDSV